ncbi:uncharacterized protein LOC106140114 [Amyelois transitella]|uniref:uncharacterized protein LOC106140114 n=1 Tax=Amyelois transitella TaxID=680683 RepID=UPI002990243A|nr:uncharacterized protein LOC106140114 [Amyelois transitella]
MRHSSTTRRPARNMTTQLLHMFLLLIAVTAEPAPGRVPKVYNALITSNQNLEPSKAYPVYQPVLHESYYPFQPAIFYGDFPLGNGIHRETAHPKDPMPQIPRDPVPQEPASSELPPPPPSPEPSEQPQNEASTLPPPPPTTQSPIPLNEFGLPPQVLPLGRIDPAYQGFSQVGPFTYTYPSFRFYDPFDPFSYSPYAPLPLYRPLGNVLGQSAPVFIGKEAIPTAAPAQRNPEPTASTPPPEPSDLNILNFESKDPAIPNVPPPPLPQGGLKSDKSA